MNILRIINEDVKGYLQIGFTASDKQEKLINCIEEMKNTYSYEMMPIRREELRNLLEACGLEYSKIIKSRPSIYQWVSRNELQNSFIALMNVKVSDRQLKQKIDFILRILNGDINFEKIREITIKDNIEKAPLYDFSVPLTQNYIADGFIVHNSTYRIYLRRGKKDTRVAKLIDSPNLPDNETVFQITAGGLKDVVL